MRQNTHAESSESDVEPIALTFMETYKLLTFLLFFVMIPYWLYVIIAGIRDQRAGRIWTTINRNLRCCFVNVAVTILVLVVWLISSLTR